MSVAPLPPTRSSTFSPASTTPRGRGPPTQRVLGSVDHALRVDLLRRTNKPTGRHGQATPPAPQPKGAKGRVVQSASRLPAAVLPAGAFATFRAGWVITYETHDRVK